MSRIKVFLDTSVLLSAFGGARISGAQSFVLTTDEVERITFEKCVFECFLAFRGVGGKKPDEGRQDWAQRFLLRDGDPVPLGNATGKLHRGSLHAAHYWTGQAEEAQWAMAGSFDEYMEEIKKVVRKEDWLLAGDEWKHLQGIFENHRRYQSLFVEFKTFLAEHSVRVMDYEDIYAKSRQPWRLMTMEGLSQRSTIPNEDFEIVVAGLLAEPDFFVSTDRRLLVASASIEANLKRCDFIHLDDVRSYIASRCAEG
jgi:hypothetical protein